MALGVRVSKQKLFVLFNNRLMAKMKCLTRQRVLASNSPNSIVELRLGLETLVQYYDSMQVPLHKVSTYDTYLAG